MTIRYNIALAPVAADRTPMEIRVHAQQFRQVDDWCIKNRYSRFTCDPIELQASLQRLARQFPDFEFVYTTQGEP